MQYSTNLNFLIRGYVHSEFGAAKKELLFGLQFDFASDDKAADGIKNALESFMNETDKATWDTF